MTQKWLKAGILEDGAVSASDRGTGQGSVISPLLANIYLHYALGLLLTSGRPAYLMPCRERAGSA
jgi:retron-type reverse transcriptase